MNTYRHEHITYYKFQELGVHGIDPVSFQTPEKSKYSERKKPLCLNLVFNRLV